VAGEDRDEDLAGAASTVRAYLLLEHPGPWGVAVLRDARLPEGLGTALQGAAREAGAKLLLIRRPGRYPAGEPARRRLFAVYADPASPWTETALLDGPEDLLDLDVARLREGRSLGLERHDDPVFAVCTHGRHDACCAERGRPAVAALAAALPEHTWEVSHIGGDRFAANMVVAPDGLYYGRLTPEAALGVARARLRGELELDHLRGRSGYPMPVQAAEIALRRHLGVVALDGLKLVSATVEGADTTAVFAAGPAPYTVRVRSTPGEPVLLTCRAVREQRPLRHEILAIER